MADNTTLNTGTGGDVVASDDIGGVKFPRVKLVYGADGVNAGDVASNNGLPIQGAQSALSSAAWTSATALNTAQSINITNMNTVTVALVQGTTLTGGQIVFEVSPDNVNWFPIQMARVDSYTVESLYNLVASTNRAWSTSVDGFTFFRVRLSTVITGTATVNVLITAQVFAIEPIIAVGQATAANLQATVTQQPLTKGTQGANGLTTQDLKDSGRVAIALTMEVAAAATTEGLATVTESRDGAATTTFTSKTLTSGKRIRFTHIAIALESLGSGTAPQRLYLRLRVNTAGATTTASPEQGVWCVINNAAIVKSGAFAFYDIPDGLEFAGNGTVTYGWTLTFPDWVTSTATAQAKVTILAFEY